MGNIMSCIVYRKTCEFLHTFSLHGVSFYIQKHYEPFKETLTHSQNALRNSGLQLTSLRAKRSVAIYNTLD